MAGQGAAPHLQRLGIQLPAEAWQVRAGLLSCCAPRALHKGPLYAHPFRTAPLLQAIAEKKMAFLMGIWCAAECMHGAACVRSAPTGRRGTAAGLCCVGHRHPSACVRLLCLLMLLPPPAHLPQVCG